MATHQTSLAPFCFRILLASRKLVPVVVTSSIRIIILPRTKVFASRPKQFSMFASLADLSKSFWTFVARKRTSVSEYGRLFCIAKIFAIVSD